MVLPDDPGAGRQVPRAGPTGGLIRSALVVAVALPGLLLAGAGLWHPLVLTPGTAHQWWTLHLVLVPVWPLLAVSLWLLLLGCSGPLAWFARVASFGYAVFYSALDLLAGVGAGLVVDTQGRGSQSMLNLLGLGDRLGAIGAWSYLVAGALTTAALWPRTGIRALPGGVVLVVASWYFLNNHLYPPLGVAAQLGIATGSALLAIVTTAGSGPNRC